MTLLSTQVGTSPSHGPLVRWHRRRLGLDNQDLVNAIAAGDPSAVRRLLRRPTRDLEEPYQVPRPHEHSPQVWFTPLEHAIDKANSSEVVDLLLQAGSRVTLPAMILALDGVCHDWGDPMEDDDDEYRHEEDFERSLRIFDLLSATGVDWVPIIAAYRAECANNPSEPSYRAKVSAEAKGVSVSQAMLARLDAIEPRREALRRDVVAQEKMVQTACPTRRLRLRS